MDLFRNGTDKTGTGQVPFTRQILSEPFVFLSEPFQFFLSCKRALNVNLNKPATAWRFDGSLSRASLEKFCSVVWDFLMFLLGK